MDDVLAVGRPRTAPHHAASSVWTGTFSVGILCLVGFVLRAAAARGDLWLDEIWSLIIVAKTNAFKDVVLALPNDNNHVLNSVWLKLVGGQASAFLIRLPSVVCGTLCVPVAARLGGRLSPHAAVALAAVVAIDYPFVQFGSEARGYSGLILAFLVALDALETRLERESPSSLVVLTLAVALGTFSHLIMLEMSGLLCIAFAIRVWLADGVSGAWFRRLLPVLLACGAGTLPALACFLASLLSGPLHTGLQTPFSYETFADGLGGMVRATIGFWPAPLPRATSEIIVPLLGVGIAATLAVLPAQRRVVPALGLLAWPIAQNVLHVPNQFYARFHILTGVCLALFLAEVGATAWGGGARMRRLTIVLSATFLVGQTAQLAQLLIYGRGHFVAATDLVTARGPTSLSVLPSVAAPETAATMRWIARRDGLASDIGLISATSLCATPPDWIVIVHRPDDPTDLDDSARLRGIPCADRFQIARTFPGYGMSGFSWTLLRRRSAT